MKALLQRVSRSSVSVDGETISSIGKGLLVLLGVENGDDAEKSAFLAKKIANMRIFEDENDKMNLSVIDIQGELLVISQFTLMANTRKGNRPSFIDAARPEIAEPMVSSFCEMLRKYDLPVYEGVFGAHMEIELVNDGPVTIWLEN